MPSDDCLDYIYCVYAYSPKNFVKSFVTVEDFLESKTNFEI